MGFGTLITDAAGKLFDISKGAFDAYSVKHQGRFDPGFDKLLAGSFTDGVKSILEKAGVTGEALETWGTSQWQDTVKQLTGALGSEIAAAGAGAAIGGPLGVALGLAMEGGQVLHNLFDESLGAWDETVNYKSGQWVAIDNGQTAVTKHMQNAIEHEWDRRRLGGKILPFAPTIEEGEGIAFAKSLSVGFVVGPGQDQNTVTVFNFLKGREEQKPLGMVRPLDETHAKQLDNNEVWSEIRLLRFKEEEGLMLDTNVPTDPGAEVIRNSDQQRYMVVESNGENVLIEHKHTGSQFWTTVDDLSPGRRAHTNSWNYQKGRVTGDIKTGGSEAAMGQGDWIWVRPEAYISSKYTTVTRMLACVQMLEGDDVVGFYAVDGSLCRVALSDRQLRPVSDDLNAYLCSSKVFNVFKDAAVRGYDTGRLAAGAHDEATLLCLGINPFDNTAADSEKIGWREKLHAKWHKQQTARRKIRLAIKKADDAGHAGLVEKLEAAEEAAALGGSTVLENENVILDKPDKPGSVFTESQAPKGNSSLVMLGLAAGAGFLFFLR